MSRSQTSNQGAGVVPAARMTPPPAQAADVSQPGRRLRVLASAAGGVFARIYPLAAAPLVFAGIGFALSASSILPRVFARTAPLISGLFLLAGLAAVFGTAGLIFATVMSVLEAIWIPVAAIVFARRTLRSQT